MYSVTTKHLQETYLRGDSSVELSLIAVDHFKTRKAAKEFIENKLKYKSNVKKHYTKGDKSSYCLWFTGKKLFSEADGETYDEYYQYTLKKI